MREPLEKIRETRARRALWRKGYKLIKSRKHDNRTRCGGYYIADPYTKTVVVGAMPHQFSLSIDEVEGWAKELTPNWWHAT